MRSRFTLLLSLFLSAGTLAAEPAMGRVQTLKATAVPAVPGREAEKLAAALEKARGKPVLVNFWASWCEPCRQEMPALQRLADSRPDLAVILVAVNDRQDDSSNFLWETSVTLAALTDREQRLSQAWGARVLPTTLLLDRRHRQRHKAVGPVEWNSRDALAVIDALLNMKGAVAKRRGAEVSREP